MHMNIEETLNSAIRTSIDKFGFANVLIAGKTGVGKSTLINAVFDGDILSTTPGKAVEIGAYERAETGQGKAKTTNIKMHGRPGLPLFIYDTRGLEVADYQRCLDDLEAFIKVRKNDSNANNHIHVGWICLAEDSRRVEEAEIALAELLSRNDIPCIIVITKARQDKPPGENKGFKAVVEEMISSAEAVCRVRALREELDDGPILEVMGLETLVTLTLECVPEGHKNAVAAAQKVDIALKRTAAHKFVATAALAAAAAAASPIPFTDTAVMPPILLTMMVSISLAFGIPLQQNILSTLVTGALAGALGPLGGIQFVSNIIKIVPGLGSLTGGALAATAAATLTTVIGEAYITALSVVINRQGRDNVTASAVAEEFKAALRGKSYH